MGIQNRDFEGSKGKGLKFLLKDVGRREDLRERCT